jgi:hypothetical protein
MTTELPDYIQDFNAALLSLDSKLSENKDALSMDEAGEILLRLNRFKDDLKAVYSGVEKLLADLMGELPEIQLSDGSRIEKSVSASRKSWKHKEIATEVASRLKDMSIDMDTGEIVLTPEDMVVKMLDYVYPSYWKVKELGKIGINADKFSEVGEVKDSIIVRKAK